MFDRLVLISLARRPDRRAAALAQLEPMRDLWGEPEVFPAIDGRKLPMPNGWPDGPGAFGCMLSHRHVIERAILDGVSSLLICEDDLQLDPAAASRWEGFAAALPDDWEGLMIGGEHMRGWHGRDRPIEVVPGVLRISQCCRTHCYAIRDRYMQNLYRHLMSTRGHCDHRMGEIQRFHRIYAPDPFIAKQGGGLSDITSKVEPERAWNWR